MSILAAAGDVPTLQSGGKTAALQNALQVMLLAGQDLGWVGGVGSAVPGEQGARGVAGCGVEFFAQYFAADREALFGIAERGGRCAFGAWIRERPRSISFLHLKVVSLICPKPLWAAVVMAQIDELD